MKIEKNICNSIIFYQNSRRPCVYPILIGQIGLHSNCGSDLASVVTIIIVNMARYTKVIQLISKKFAF